MKEIDRGQQLMIDGMERVIGNQTTSWTMNYENLVNEFLTTHHFFTGEDVTVWMLTRIGSPTHGNAWGAMFNAHFTKDPMVVWTGRLVNRQSTQSHASLTREYRSKLFNG